MDYLRTPSERFENLPGYPYDEKYFQVDEASGLRMHYVDEGKAILPGLPTVLLLHGEPSWSYLYRRMIPVIAEAGYRVVAPDLIGFGKSDKPTQESAYTYDSHESWLTTFVRGMNLDHVLLVCQDWGGLLGLRLVAREPERFAGVVAANTFLPSGREPVGEAFEKWRTFARESKEFHIGKVVAKGCIEPLSDAVLAAYDAPFPEEKYKVGARMFPSLVPIDPEGKDAKVNQELWKSLQKFEKPFLTCFSDGDPITRGADRFLQALIPGSKERTHPTIAGGGHFLQEDRGPELARHVVEFAAKL